MTQNDSDETEEPTLNYDDGDDCPTDGCEHDVHVREFDRDPQFDTEATGPLAEAFCPVHGFKDRI